MRRRVGGGGDLGVCVYGYGRMGLGGGWLWEDGIKQCRFMEFYGDR